MSTGNHQEITHVLQADQRTGGGSTLRQSTDRNSQSCSLNIISLKCWGIKRKINYPEFQELIQEHDILSFQETNTDDVDEINSESFKTMMTSRIIYGRVNSGEIILAFRQDLSESISVRSTGSKTVLWSKFQKSLLIYRKKLFIGIVYIPPKNSKYICRDSCSMIELEMQELSADDKNVILR